MIINRDFYLNKLISARQNNMVKVITGIRRCGKSFLLFNLFKEYLSQNGIDESHFIEIQFVILLLESTEMQKKHIIS
ncbi:MAG: AAA family ATPase [Treponema succinifaciens]|uniref:AAA family ATPase n=1 Tax=Treponema TaxID=157 RepID=UPI0023F2C76D|nr:MULTISPECIES: AAA family ATPase [Treponema]MDD6962747.1 AAA family ATPase [Treponema succinifaciens]MDY5117347.1 AAA family ATPase [Treponema succinifaciens]